MRRLAPCFAALVLVVAACGDDDDATTTTTTSEAVTTVEETTSSSTSTSESSTSTTSAPGDEPTLEQSCTSPEGFTISYPADWEAVSDCGQFGPAPVREPEPQTDERPGVVSAYVDPVAFDIVTEPREGEQARETATVADRPAVRISSELTGEGLYPAGTRSVQWIVDLSGDGGDQPRTLFLDAYDLAHDVDFDEAVTVLDAMVETVELDGVAS